ncbi:hypothetical protein GGS24DRAFT_516627 [Hypoxylon argillaceum]|nr:hypothetical protein GGS24DRAFT_516627 [Hypoxylon argillaceum]
MIVSKFVFKDQVISKTLIGFNAFWGLGSYVLETSNLTQQREQKLDRSRRPANDTTGLFRLALLTVDAAPQEPRSTGSIAPSAWFPEKFVWTFGSSPYFAIRHELRRYLDGAWIQQYDTTYIGSIVAKNLWRNATVNFDSVDVFMHILSDVMTARIRNNSPNGVEDYAVGSVILNTICVQIQWA